MALQKDLPTTIRMIYLLGGLAPDTTDPMPADLQNTIQQNWHQIEKTIPTIHFNYDFWLLNTPFRSTFPACRAILAARKQGTQFEPKILRAIQTTYYQNAKNPSLQATLKECATEVGLDVVEFIKDMTSSAIDGVLQEEIKLAKSMDVFSYPSLRLLHNEELFSIGIDYLNHRTMMNEITDILTINGI
jgi:putative protein-disulfide isomerase